MTADELLQNVKDRAAVPPGQTILTDAKILSDANEEMLALVGPVLESTSEEYFTTSIDYTIVGSQSAYAMPADAMGGSVRKVVYVDANGVEFDAPLSRIDIADIGKYSMLASNEPLAFWYSATAINIVPTPQASPSGSLRVYYSARTPKVGNTLATDYLLGTLSSVNAWTQPNTATFTTATIGAPFSLGATIEFYSEQNPAQVLASGVITAVQQQTFGGTLYGELLTTPSWAGYATLYSQQSAGYQVYASVKGLKAYVPRLPLEWHSLLELRTAVRAMLKMGNFNEAKICMQTAQEMQVSLLRVASPRAAQNPRKISAWRR